MNDDHLISVSQLREFVKLQNSVKLKTKESKQETYKWVGTTLGKFKYNSLGRQDKSIVKKYIIIITGYSEGAVDKLISRKKEIGTLIPKERTQNNFPTIYTDADIVLLAKVCNATLGQNGKAIKEMCKSMYQDYADQDFERLANISVSHIYNLKKKHVYQTENLTYTKTNPVQRDISIRKKPEPNGIPGYIRVDSVHQGNLEKEKGVYHINLVDEVTQCEYVCCVEKISEYYLIPLLTEMIKSFPFKVHSFHSDNGSEYINYQVANMLNKMTIDQTKSRARHSNDNALAEGKNGAVIRKYLGHTHIPQKYAKTINVFDQKYFNPYINYHRYCAFATDCIDSRGKIKKEYKIYMTPIQKLLSLENCEQYLKEGVTKEDLIAETKKTNHFEAAKKVVEEKQKLFKEINKKTNQKSVV